MNQPSLAFLVVFTLAVGPAFADQDAAAASAELTAKHLAITSAALATFEKGLNDTATNRSEQINAVRTLAYNGRWQAEREVEILTDTDGADVVRTYQALIAHGDKAALASSEAAAAEAASRTEIAAAFTPLSISTEKLDSAAKTLAGLAKQQTAKEQATFLLQFLKDTRTDTKKLLEDSKNAKDEAQAKLEATTAAASKSGAAAAEASNK